MAIESVSWKIVQGTKNVKSLKFSVYLITALLAATSMANAEINCSRVGADPYNTNETFYIDGPTGLYSYNAYDGQRQVLELQCDTHQNNGADVAVCSRTFQRTDGLTVEHYVIPRVSTFTTIYISTFVENARSEFYSAQHRGNYQQISITCD